MQLDMPAMSRNAFREHGHFREGCRASMTDGVAHASYTLFVQTSKFGVGYIRAQRRNHASRTADFPERGEVAAVVESITARLHKYDPLYAKHVEDFR
jgi:hypothetical protein